MTVARCTVERLMRQIGLAGRTRGKKRRTTIPDDARRGAPVTWLSVGFAAEGTEPVVDRRHHLRRHVVRVRLHGVRHRRVLPAHRRLAGRHHVRTDLALDALEMAIWSRQPNLDGLVHHSDRGSAIPVDPLQRTPRRRRRRHLRRLTRRLLRQRHGRVDHRPLQDRTDLPHAVHGAASTTSNWQPCAGSTGGTPPASTRPSATSHPTSSRPLTTLNNNRPTRPESTKPSLYQTRGGSAIGERVLDRTVGSSQRRGVAVWLR